MKLEAISRPDLLLVIRSCLPHLISIAKCLYDKWISNKTGNGICSYIAESWSKYINNTYRGQGVRATEYYDNPIGIGEHVKVIIYGGNISYIIDLPHTLYEKKVGKYSWVKIPDARFTTGQITIEPGPPME